MNTNRHYLFIYNPLICQSAPWDLHVYMYMYYHATCTRLWYYAIMCIHYSCTLPMHVIMYWITGDYTRDPLLSLWLKPTRPWPSLSQSLMRESMWTSTMRPSRPSSRVVYGPSRSPWGGSRYFNFCPHRWHSAVNCHDHIN